MPPMRSPAGMNTPRFDLSRNPPYQINFRAKRAGKTISASKRRITFQFGFSSASAISSGKNGVDCRGEEHEVVLIWSHMTGKRQLYMDGREVHMSKAGMGNTQFMHSWVIPGNHIVKITAYGTPPLGGENANFRQFDLEVDGMSYFSFKKIYELGEGTVVRRREVAPPASTMAKPPETLMYSYVGMAVDDDDEDEYDEAPLTMRSAPARIAPVNTGLFNSLPPTPVATPASQSQFSAMHSHFKPPTQVQVSTSTMSQNNSVPLAVSSSSLSHMSSYDEFAPVAVPQAPLKSFDFISNQILGAYENNSSYSSAPYNPSHPISSQADDPDQEESTNAMTKSMKNLVNLDDITATQSSNYGNKKSTPRTMNQQGNNWGFTGRAPTLSEINSAVRPLVMNTHHNAAIQQGYQQGQPQYHTGQPQAMASNYGYHQNNQQQQYVPNMGYAPAY
jgi:hypothetical protein